MKKVSFAVIFVFVFLAATSFYGANFVFAQNFWAGTSGGGCNVASGGCNICDALIVASNVINFLFYIAIPLAVGMIVYGAVRLMLSGGSQERITASRQTITKAFFGLVIALSAWIIVNELLLILSGSPDFPWHEITCS